MSEGCILSSSSTTADLLALQPAKECGQVFECEAKREPLSLTNRNEDGPAHIYFKPMMSKPEF